MSRSVVGEVNVGAGWSGGGVCSVCVVDPHGWRSGRC